jgi:Rho-binding antiterminator
LAHYADADPGSAASPALPGIDEGQDTGASTVMTTHPSDYSPISCEFHDRLEDIATLRKPTRIVFRDTEGVEQQRDATIADVYAKAGAEYALLGSGETLRLDQLIEVDGEKLSDY